MPLNKAGPTAKATEASSYQVSEPGLLLARKSLDYILYSLKEITIDRNEEYAALTCESNGKLRLTDFGPPTPAGTSSIHPPILRHEFSTARCIVQSR